LDFFFWELVEGYFGWGRNWVGVVIKIMLDCMFI
jgi:hypothetical protein